MRDMADEEATEKSATMQRLIQTSREAEVSAKRQFLQFSARESQLYGNHMADVQRRKNKVKKEADLAEQRLRQQQDEQRQAVLRMRALKEEKSARLMEKRIEFEKAREAVLEVRAREEAKKDEKINQLRLKAKEMAAHVAAFEARKQAEYDAKLRASADRLNATSSSFAFAVASENANRREKYEQEQAAVEARIAARNEERTLSARAHASRHDATVERFRQEKQAADSQRAASYNREALEKQRRLDAMRGASREQEDALQKQLRAEFATKSGIEHVRWKSSVYKSPPPVVKSDLNAVKGMPA